MVAGKEYMTRQKTVQAMVTMLAARPHLPSQNGPRLMLLRPRYQRQRIGHEYERYSNVMHAVTMLLNAVDEPRYSRPNAATMKQLTVCAMSGTSRVLLT